MKHAGFTLVELLVVIATIALLMAILVPVLQNTRFQAKAVLCSSNIKQLTITLLMYEAVNKTFPPGVRDSLTPPPGGHAGNPVYDRMGWWWFNYIEDLYNKADNKKSILNCPSKNLTDLELKDNILCGNYGVNLSICKSVEDRENLAEFIGKSLNVDDIQRPSKTLLILDSGYAIINWWHAADEPPEPLDETYIEDTTYIPGLKINKEKEKEGALWPGQENDAINGRHPHKTVNAGFADGHCARIKADKLLVEKTGDTYKNRSPLWLPK